MLHCILGYLEIYLDTLFVYSCHPVSFSSQTYRVEERGSQTREAMTTVHRLETELKIGYFTDVEGNLEYFESYLRVSDCLYYHKKEVLQDSGGMKQLELRDGYVFVYGGVSTAFALTYEADRSNRLGFI